MTHIGGTFSIYSFFSGGEKFKHGIETVINLHFSHFSFVSKQPKGVIEIGGKMNCDN